MSWEPEVACREELPQHLLGLSLPKILGHRCHKRCTTARHGAAPLRARGRHQTQSHTSNAQAFGLLFSGPLHSLRLGLKSREKNVLQRPSCASTELACKPLYTQPLWINIWPRWPRHLQLNKTSPVTKPQTTVTISTQLERLWFHTSVISRVSPFKGERKPQVAICFNQAQNLPLLYTCPLTLQVRNISHDELSCWPALININ